MIHIVFCPSAAGTLRQVLRERGLQQPVATLTEWLDWGPITTGGFAERAKWLDVNAPTDDGGWEWIAEEAQRFRTAVANASDRLIWLAPKSAAEQCGLYWYLAQYAGPRCEMIIADYPLGGLGQEDPPISLGSLGKDAMAKLSDDCPRVELDQARFSAERWQALVADGALLRVVENGILKSVPESFFDRFLFRRCSDQWSRIMRVVGYTMGDLWEAGHSAGGSTLIWRLRQMIKAGVIECDGDLPTDGLLGGETMVRRARTPQQGSGA